MIKSMTAFAREELTEDGLSVIIEIRTYNSRHLDVALHMPHDYLSLEEKIKSLLSNRIVRGRVTIRFEMKREADSISEYVIDMPKAASSFQALSRLRESLGIEGDISLDLVLGMGDIIKPDEAKMDMEKWERLVLTCLDRAVDQLDAMRKKEGDFLAGDFEKRLDLLDHIIGEIEAGSDGLIDHYQAQLKERISKLTRGTIELDPERITQEAALLADKSDISEEIVRIKSHINQFRALIPDKEPAGRKLNFLLQEFNREFNTIGSKTGNAGVSYRVVDAKAEIEKLREQIQNVE